MKSYTFLSSTNPKKRYTTTIDDDGRVSCDCRGFWTPNQCWHVKRVKEEPIEFKVSIEDRCIICDLVDIGLDAGDFVLTLFPSMSWEEATELIDEIVMGEFNGM